MKQKKKVAYRITLYIMTLQIVIFVMLYIFMSKTITGNIRENTVESMKTIVDDRSQIIESYVRKAEGYLTAYSRSRRNCGSFGRPIQSRRCRCRSEIY